jgi:hypothetical protein
MVDAKGCGEIAAYWLGNRTRLPTLVVRDAEAAA